MTRTLSLLMLGLIVAGCSFGRSEQAPAYDRAALDAFAARITNPKDTITLLGLPVLCFSHAHCAVERGNFGCEREGMFLVCDRGVYRARLAKHEA